MRLANSSIVFLVIFFFAVLIRTLHVSTQSIFIGDQGRDALEALKVVGGESYPLMGIPSSIPRFQQGVFYIYLMAGALAIKQSLTSLIVLSTVIGIATIPAWFLLIRKYGSIATSLLFSLLLTFSPMLILHSRMPFVINPVPLSIAIYIWQLLRWSEGKKWSAFFVGLSFALVYHGELATFPLVLLIPFVLWKRKLPVFKQSMRVVAGVALGLLPHILYDLTHGFSQLGGFALWMVYRLFSAFIPTTDHSLYTTSLGSSLTSIAVLMTRIVTESTNALMISLWIVVFAVSLGYLVFKRNTLSLLDQLMLLGASLLLIAFIIHRAPSEAYMPGFVPFFLYVIARALGMIRIWISIPLTIILASSLVMSVITVINSRYMVGRFGATSGEQVELIRQAYNRSGRCITLDSLGRKSAFPTHIDNYIFLVKAAGYDQGEQCTAVLIDKNANGIWEAYVSK